MGQELMKYPSKSKPGKFYTVKEANDGSLYCDCWQWKRNRDCSHLKNYRSNSENVLNAALTETGIQVKVESSRKDSGVVKVIDNIINRFQ